MKKFFPFSLVLALSVLCASKSLAFYFSPFVLKLELKKGEIYKQTFIVGNSWSKSIKCAISVSGWELLRSGEVVCETVQKSYSAASWIKIKEVEFNLPSGGEKKIEAEITVPKYASAGDYFASVAVKASILEDIKQKGVTQSVETCFRSALQIHVFGFMPSVKAEVIEFKVIMPEEKEQDIKIFAALKNFSRVHLDARAQVEIRNSAGEIFDRFDLYGAGKNIRGDAFVYPEGIRDFWGSISRPLAEGEYVAEISFVYGSRFQTNKAAINFVVSRELGQKQKEFLTLIVEPELLEIEVSPKSFRTKTVKISNLDFEALEVQIVSQEDWLKVKPDVLKIQPGKTKNCRIEISIFEEVEREGRIFVQPERGKVKEIDVIVKVKEVEKR
ncbi:hypothetical protein COT20_01270 [bacterium (Candidatus Gribaldobacteria) CG08_land_8_20_14_0_20_39_15]|uniref:BACON domain-containing protein n=1 Tax=bacterium (Candidatus Gribaldobacteria) CG08_land_8_20_14_0_20_39_15 TaxID=2014273 RepID=A0A2M6XUR9_9BACT|nr:MAG: hypothetical protein COT20_01270 [bacterium (Candidatus Gribaldobacteria) CG08_land_8_20_14_0_20_39_15]